MQAEPLKVEDLISLSRCEALAMLRRINDEMEDPEGCHCANSCKTTNKPIQYVCP